MKKGLNDSMELSMIETIDFIGVQMVLHTAIKKCAQWQRRFVTKYEKVGQLFPRTRLFVDCRLIVLWQVT